MSPVPVTPDGKPVQWDEEVNIINASLLLGESRTEKGELIRELILVMVDQKKAYRVKFDMNGSKILSEFFSRPDIQVAQQIPQQIVMPDRHG